MFIQLAAENKNVWPGLVNVVWSNIVFVIGDQYDNKYLGKVDVAVMMTKLVD